MTATPMMKQYDDAKAACGDALLLFRMGDFYEMFHDDAKTAARVLGLALTSRDKNENPVPMAGFPHHQLESYLGKLIAAGMRVAVCDQVEDPKQAKGLVRREVTRIVTPGTVTDDGLLDPRRSNYLAAVLPGRPTGVAWAELSTGRFFAACFPPERLADELARIGPAECLLPEESEPVPDGAPAWGLVTRRPPWAFNVHSARQALSRHFGTANLEGFGFSDDDAPAVAAAGAIFDYLVETQKSSLAHVDRLERYHVGQTLEVDESTRRSLEITQTMREGARAGSLLDAIDRTVTAMGARLLADWLASPLAQAEAIMERQAAVAEFVRDPTLLDSLQELLRAVYDLERLLARVATGRASPRDLAFIGRTLRVLPQLKAKLAARESLLLTRLEAAIDLCPRLRSRIDAALEDDCPLSSRDGGFIRGGYSAQLDALRDLTAGGKQWIARYQAEESARSGIATLKVGFNKVFGYYLEITNAKADKIPPHYIRKQTVKNAERYVTPELKEYEEKVLTADERSRELEYQLFVELRDAAAEHARALQATASVLATLDVLLSLARLARERSYCRPTITAEPVLRIIGGRHPVLDQLMPEGQFVPNDTICGPDEGLILLITGPNMAGKSTFIRQTALITLLAQIGGFVPAQEALIGAADRIFARVGASDELARGQSTFMVEMVETARILNAATANSLVILDEIGRGTSTYDGLSLAWAVVEHLHDDVKARTLFATHYHELTALASDFLSLRNYNVAVREWREDVVFLHQIVSGAADKSYGIHVARLAGVPSAVVERAKRILAQLESNNLDRQGHAKIARRAARQRDLQLTLFGGEEHPLLDELRSLKLDELAPLASWQWLERWQRELKNGNR